MGRRGPLPKKPEDRHRDEKPAVVALASRRPRAPTPPPGLSPETKAIWKEYWESDVSRATIKVEQLSAVRRYFLYLDEWATCFAAYREERVVEGNRSLIVNPLGGMALKLEDRLVRLEGDLGLSPMARTRLGIAIGQARLTAAELNAMTKRKPEAIDAEWEPA